VLEVGVSEVIARRVWVQADMWLQKIVDVGGEMGTLVPHGLHTIVALVEFEGIFLPPPLYQDIEEIYRLISLACKGNLSTKEIYLQACSLACKARPMPS
jgi:hypothetical protein